MQNEGYPETKLQYTYKQVLTALYDIMPLYHPKDGIDEFSKVETLEEDIYERTIKKFNLTAEFSSLIGLKSKIRCQIVPDYLGDGGITLIMRSRNLFESRQLGFYVQPHSFDPNYDVYQAPVRPKNEQYFTVLLEMEKKEICDPDIANGLIASLLLNTQSKD